MAQAVPDGRPLNMVLTPEVRGATLLWATWEVLALDRDGLPLNMDLTRGALAATLLSEKQAPARVPARSGLMLEGIPLLEQRAQAPARLSSGPTPAGQGIPDNRATSITGGDVRKICSTR
jgi:hypothetical protein